MKLNLKVQYGVACLFELSKHPGEYMDAQEIASKQNIPPAYAHKILQSLSHVGLVYAVKGIGYRLSRPLANITALELVEALSVEPDPTATNPEIGAVLERRINKMLGSFTLGELI